MPRKSIEKTERSESSPTTEYGQLVVLATSASLSNIQAQVYQWRTSAGVIEGPLAEWLDKLGITDDQAQALARTDPLLAALNHLAADGWTLVAFHEVEPSKLTYDRGRHPLPNPGDPAPTKTTPARDPCFVTTRCWLTRPRPTHQARPAKPRKPKR